MTHNKIHLIFSSDQSLLKPLVVCIFSILKNTEHSDQIVFHMVVENEASKKTMTDLIEEFLNDYQIQYQIAIPDPIDLNKLTELIRVTQDNSNISNVMNFARFLFPKLFPELDRVIYVDIDMICQGDIWELAQMQMDKPLVALPDKLFKESFAPAYLKQRYDPNYRGFNAGLYLTRLNYWRENDLLSKIYQLMLAHKKSQNGLFRLGTQPLVNLIFYKNYQKILPGWNVKDLGFDYTLDTEILSQAKLLHWNGAAKPWYSNGLYQDLWDPYNFWPNDPKSFNPKIKPPNPPTKPKKRWHRQRWRGRLHKGRKGSHHSGRGGRGGRGRGRGRGLGGRRGRGGTGKTTK